WMRSKVLLFAAAASLLVWTACAINSKPKESPTSGKLSLYVSDSHAALAAKEADLFCSLYNDAHITLYSASTRECLVHLINDSVRMVLTDRALNAEERRIITQEKLKIDSLQVAVDALALLVNRVNDLQALSMAELTGIIDQRLTTWQQLPGSGLTGRLELVTTGKNSGAYELLKNHFLHRIEDFVPAVMTAAQSEVVKYVAKHPQALGIASLACLKEDSLKALSEEPDGAVRTLAFTGTDSTGALVHYKLHQANVYLKKYPLYYPLHVYFNHKSQLAAGFCAFIASAPGQKLILNSGLVPTTMPIRLVQIR
ncbi:MAG TPA: substrate-binding domain-containing protein, partial [bacterium]|nr:substrate-binding domain-containing protein [bacterium]